MNMYIRAYLLKLFQYKIKLNLINMVKLSIVELVRISPITLIVRFDTKNLDIYIISRLNQNFFQIK